MMERLMDIKEMNARIELCKSGRRLAEFGLVHSNLGTISMAMREQGPDVFLTKPGPLNYLDAEPKDFVLIDTDGKVLEEEKDQPSLNWLVHRACYRARPDIGAVVHAHPRHVVILTSQEKIKQFRLVTGEAVWLVKPSNPSYPIPVVENLDPYPLAKAVSAVITDTNVVVIKNHGVVTVGKDIAEATAAALVIEEEVAIICGIYQMNGTPAYLSAEKIRHELANIPPWFSKPFDSSI